jgi:glycosyltransferase involved in cell wall biosynthesis
MFGELTLVEKKIKIARLWSRYDGNVPSRTPIILGLDNQKFETVCIYLKKSSEKSNFFEEKGFKAFYISRKEFFRIFNVFAIWKLARILKDENVNILHCHRHQATVYGTFAAMIAGTPIVLGHVHGLNRSRPLRRKLINAFILRRITRLMAVGESVKQDILNQNRFLSREKVISLGNSIDVDQFSDSAITKEQAKKMLGLPADSFVYGTAGRMVPTKGYSYLIQAFIKVKQKISNAHLVFAGDGRLRSELEEVAEKEGLAPFIHFLGRRSDMPDVLRAMDVFVLSSIAEGIPRAMLEAMAAGIPCIGTDVGGIGEILDNGRLGSFVKPYNTVELAEAMVNVTRKTVNRVEVLGAARRKIIQSYSHDVLRKRLEKIYETLYKSTLS